MSETRTLENAKPIKKRREEEGNEKNCQLKELTKLTITRLDI